MPDLPDPAVAAIEAVLEQRALSALTEISSHCSDLIRMLPIWPPVAWTSPASIRSAASRR